MRSRIPSNSAHGNPKFDNAGWRNHAQAFVERVRRIEAKYAALIEAGVALAVASSFAFGVTLILAASGVAAPGP